MSEDASARRKRVQGERAAVERYKRDRGAWIETEDILDTKTRAICQRLDGIRELLDHIWKATRD